MEMLVVASFLAVVAKSIIDAIAEPVRKRYPEADMWWLIYVTWALGGALSYLAGVNLFTAIVPSLDPLVGQVLTAITVGGGSSLVYDLFDKK